MKKGLILSAAIILSSLASASFAGDAATGKAQSAICSGCHGANGISNSDVWPNLAGKKQAYLANALQMYRDGRRKNKMMSARAKNLTDADIANLAAYYASLK
ncbi:MAG: cytochrome c [Porticoccaceae bacterium]|nr:cytochrome c [Porticoccaceae bacterium]